MFDESKLSLEAKGLNTGIAQRAAWFDSLLKHAEKQGCDIEKLTDDAIFPFGQAAIKGNHGNGPHDLCRAMTEDPVFYELFAKEIIKDTDDECEIRLLDYSSDQSNICDCEKRECACALEQEIRLLNAREAGKILGVNANTVYSLWNKKLLGYWMLHKSKKTNLRAIAEFLDKTQNKVLDTD